jgi:hypothetical protein
MRLRNAWVGGSSPFRGTIIPTPIAGEPISALKRPRTPSRRRVDDDTVDQLMQEPSLRHRLLLGILSSFSTAPRQAFIVSGWTLMADACSVSAGLLLQSGHWWAAGWVQNGELPIGNISHQGSATTRPLIP